MWETSQARFAVRLLAWAFGILAVLAVGTAALAQAGGTTGQFAIGLAILTTSFLVGGLLGFLFSLPRVLAQPASAAQPASGGTGRQLVRTNSNLEQVSDWLTMLLIGYGLAELNWANDALRRFSDFVGRTAPACKAGVCPLLPTLAPMALVTGLVLGFFAMYVITRVVIVRLFEEVEAGLSREQQRAVFGTAAASARLDPGTDAATLLAPALKQGPVTVEDSLDVMLAQLYQVDTAGYQRTIDLAAVLAETGARRSADYWFYLSAAWGQKHAALAAGGGADAMRTARDQAIAAARRAIGIDPSYRARLAALALGDPADRMADNDLASLVDDQELRDLLKLGPIPSPAT